MASGRIDRRRALSSTARPLPRLLAHPASGNDDYDVLADGVVVDRIFKANAAPVASAWMHHEDRPPTHGYAASREGAMAAFAKSWRRE
jgi:hypothetical protein